jgi:hypothetical protein
MTEPDRMDGVDVTAYGLAGALLVWALRGLWRAFWRPV